MGFLDRTKRVADDTNAGASMEDKVARDKFPTLVEAMTCRANIEGKDVNRCSLSVFVAEGVWKAILRDKVDTLACWVASKTLAGLFPVLEAALLDPDHEWRLDRFLGHEKAKRAKKGG